MYINATEERYFKTFLENKSDIRTIIEKLLGAGRYKELTESDRFLLHSLGFKGVFSEDSVLNQEIGHKTLQFVAFLYELDELQYLRLVRITRALGIIERAIRDSYISTNQLDKSKFYCVYNPTNARLPLTAKNNQLSLGDDVKAELEYIYNQANNASEGEWEANTLATYTLRNTHLTDITDNMVIFHIGGYPFFILLGGE